MLSWRCHGTLRRTLESFRERDFFSLFGDAFIYFQACDEGDAAIAREFGLRYGGSARNLGILGGMRAAAQQVRGDYVLYLENDCVLIEPRQEAARQLAVALSHMQSGRAQVYRLRHRARPGTDFQAAAKYLRYHPAPSAGAPDTALRRVRRFLRPLKARRLMGGAVYVEPHPERRFPRHIARAEEGHFLVDSACMPWTNQAILYPRQWFLDEIAARAEAHPSSRPVNGFPDVERELNRRWWRQRHFRIGVAPGLFTHARMERPAEDEKNLR